MTWADEPADYRATAEKVCTPAELEVLRLVSHGYGVRRGSTILSISPELWRYRRDAANRKIEKAQKETAA